MSQEPSKLNLADLEERQARAAAEAKACEIIIEAMKTANAVFVEAGFQPNEASDMIDEILQTHLDA